MSCSPEIFWIPENVFWHWWKHTRRQIYCVIWQQKSDKISTICIKISHLCRHFVSVANFNFCQNWVFQLHLVLGKYVIWGYFQKDVLIDLHLNFQTNGKLPVMQGATQSITPTGANHKDPVQQTVLDFIWHFSFHYALCHSELRILLSYRNLQKNLSGGVGERTQNKVSTGICVILHKVQVILGRMEWKQDPKIIWPVRATSIKLFLMLK